MTPAERERRLEKRTTAMVASVVLIMVAVGVVVGLFREAGMRVYRSLFARRVVSAPASEDPADLAPPIYAVRREGEVTTLLRYHVLEGRREELGPLRTPRPLERLTCIEPPHDCYALSGPEAPGRSLYRVDAAAREATEVPGSPSSQLSQVQDMGVRYGPGELLLATSREVVVFDPVAESFSRPLAVQGEDSLVAIVVLEDGGPTFMLRGVGEVGRAEQVERNPERRTSSALKHPIPLGPPRELRVCRYVPGLGQWFLVVDDPEAGGDGERWFLVDAGTGLVSAAR